MRTLLAPVLALAVGVPSASLAVEYDCKVERKLDSERICSEEQLQKGHFSIRLVDEGKTATLHRCSASSAGAVTCEPHQVDKIAADETATFDSKGRLLDDGVKIKKYYVFRGQFDVQIFPTLTFVENNGRGGIAFGTCRVVSP